MKRLVGRHVGGGSRKLLGVGLIRSTRSVRPKPVRNVMVGWLVTPAVACLLSVGMWVACHLRYVG